MLGNQAVEKKHVRKFVYKNKKSEETYSFITKE